MDEKIEEVLNNAEDLKETTRKKNRMHIRQLKEATGKESAWEMMSDVEGTMAEIMKRENANTRQAFVSTICGILKRVEGGSGELYGKWQRAARPLHDAAYHRQGSNKWSEAKQERLKDVNWKKICAARERLKKTNQTYLLMSMYTMMPPVRADYGEIKIYQESELEAGRRRLCEIAEEKVETTKSKHRRRQSEAVKEAEERPGNFLVIGERRTVEGRVEKKMKIYLTEHKVSSKMPLWCTELPGELVGVITKSLEERPREYLITNSRGEPYEDGHKFAGYAGEVMGRAYGERIGALNITDVRHFYIDHRKPGQMTTNEKRKLAREMMHTATTQDEYRRFFAGDDREEETSIEVEISERDEEEEIDLDSVDDMEEMHGEDSTAGDDGSRDARDAEGEDGRHIKEAGRAIEGGSMTVVENMVQVLRGMGKEVAEMKTGDPTELRQMKEVIRKMGVISEMI